MSRLRRKIERDSKNPALIATVWGGGYRFAGHGGARMTLAPKSLAGQLTLLLLIALAAAQGIAVALFAWERLEALRHAHRDNAVLRTATVARLLGDTPAGLHDSVIAAASTDLARFSLTVEPAVGETDTGERAAAIADDLSAALGVRAARVRVAPLWTRYFDDDDGDDHHDLDDDDDDDDRDGDRDDDGPAATPGIPVCSGLAKRDFRQSCRSPRRHPHRG